ncbi:hypothetical protein R75461_07763 [Paraburkholderia nemoris]|uniref:hypothetical protein n=1 Tax=Paraburkholderia nemoris TaxID=2793076 RepID=UPI00190A2145|nr:MULTISPECIES: hypothetical protein [Paraburkholderia]MBK3786538.1 hypothetical protein [Paraburkholderia aspalathi]CAE6856939.1 hypothetical protein R75461_07763 [Paraburkholderia nemoris]
MKTGRARFIAGGALPPRSVTLGDEVRAEAKRRGGRWARCANDCAVQAEKMYGRRPLHGDELKTVFDEVFRCDAK